MKKNHVILKIVLAIVGIFLILAVCAGGYIASKLSKMQYENLDKNDLSVNDNLYNDVKNNTEDTITEEEFKDVVNIVFFGSDSRDVSSMESGRSDTIMIASINPVLKTIKLISIPRDTYVNVPGYGMTKINHAYAYGKEQLSIKTINNNFGLNITEYVTIDFSGLIHIINKIGGVTLQITEEERDYINKAVAETYKMTGNTLQKVESSGRVTLSGEQALTHSRNRTIGNDFTRAGRQRDVVEALLNKIATLDIGTIMGLSDEFLKEVKTNVNITNYLGLITSVITNKNAYFSNIISTQIPSLEYAQGKMINGVYYFVSDLQTAKKDFISYLYEK